MKKIRNIIVGLAVITVLFTNFQALYADGFLNYVPYRTDIPAVGDLKHCPQNLGGHWSRGSVEWVCTVQWVCPECTCIPEACGHVSNGHIY